MSGIGEEVGERADVLSEELLSVLLELTERERGFEGGGADQTLREALAAVAAFRQAKELDDSAVEALARSRTLLDKAQTMIGDEGCRDSVRDASEFVERLRSRSIELMVQRDRALSVDRGVAPPAPGFALSLGTPALVTGVEVAVPRLFARDTADRPRLRREERDPGTDQDDDDDDLVLENQGVDEPWDEAPVEQRPRSRHGEPGERLQIEALARDAMEDLASLSTLRVLWENEPWREGEPFERRLLAHLDTLVALARPVRSGGAELDLAEALFAYATEWAVPDRGRAFGFALTLCCVDSDAALLWVTMALRRAAPLTLPAYVDALALGSNPRIPAMLFSLLSDDIPRELMIVALHAALRRRLFNAGRMLALSSHPDPEVAALATRCFAFAPASLSQPGLSELAHSQSHMVRAAAGQSMIEIGMPQGRQVLRDLLDEIVGRGDPALLRPPPESVGEDSCSPRSAALVALRALAVHADPKDAERIWASAHALKSYREIGFFGHVAHVPQLFATLDELSSIPPGESTDGWHERTERTAGAILRITGITPPSFGTGRYDLAGLKQLWSERGPDVQSVAQREGRIRFGKAWSKKGIVDELSDPETHHGDRRLLADELTLASGGELRFDIDGWVANQRAFLKMVSEAFG